MTHRLYLDKNKIESKMIHTCTDLFKHLGQKKKKFKKLFPITIKKLSKNPNSLCYTGH